MFLLKQSSLNSFFNILSYSLSSFTPELSTLLTLSACCRVCLCRCLYRLKRAFLLRPIPFSLGKSTESLGGVPRPLLWETPSTEDTPLLDGVLLEPAWCHENQRGHTLSCMFIRYTHSSYFYLHEGYIFQLLLKLSLIQLYLQFGGCSLW